MLSLQLLVDFQIFEQMEVGKDQPKNRTKPNRIENGQDSSIADEIHAFLQILRFKKCKNENFHFLNLSTATLLQ